MPHHLLALTAVLDLPVLCASNERKAKVAGTVVDDNYEALIRVCHVSETGKVLPIRNHRTAVERRLVKTAI